MPVALLSRSCADGACWPLVWGRGSPSSPINPVAAHASSHTLACQESSAHNRHRWAQKVPTAAPTGARGTTESQTLSVCTSSSDDDRSNHAWVAVDDNGGDPFDLVQAGRITCEGSQAACTLAQRKFWAWGRQNSEPGCSGLSDVAPIAQSLGTWSSGSDDFIVARSGGFWKVYIDGVFQNQVSEASICWAKKRALWSGETWDLGDAMGGSAGNKFALTQAAYQTTVGGSWLNPGFTPGNACQNSPDVEPPFFCTTPASNSLSLWADH